MLYLHTWNNIAWILWVGVLNYSLQKSIRLSVVTDSSCICLHSDTSQLPKLCIVFWSILPADNIRKGRFLSILHLQQSIEGKLKVPVLDQCLYYSHIQRPWCSGDGSGAYVMLWLVCWTSTLVVWVQFP